MRLARALPFTLALAATLLAFAGAAGSAPPSLGQPQRDHDRGRWFAHSCAQAGTGYASCSAQVVTDSDGSPLASSSPPSGSYGSAQFHGAYGLPTTAGSVKTIAIVDAYDDPNIANDLASYDSQYGLPAVNTYTSSSTPSPWFRKVNQSGGTSYPSGNTGWGLEIALDVETAHEICQNCNVLLVEASSNSFGNLLTAENEAVALGANVVSNSWGGGEFSGETSYDSAFDHSGVVITASTGDSGYGVEYPASSRYVVGVGGTTLNLGSNNSYGGERAWVDGGSGCSGYETKPGWQTDTGCSHKTVADVSADADPNTGAAVLDTYGYGGWLQVGGTSLASPLIASVFALSGNTTNGSTPYSNRSGLHDVTSGSNGSCGGSYLCTAGSGYDGPTGLGTPNGLTAFGGAPATPDFSLSATPGSQTVTQGQTASYTVSMTPSDGFADSVAVAVTGAPGSPSGCTLTTGTPSCTISVPTTGSTPTGTYTLAFTGTDTSNSALSHTAGASLTVNAPAAGNFSLSISPSSRTLRTPGSTTYTVTISDQNGFTGAVNLVVSGLPAGVTGTFSANPATSSSTLTVSTTAKHRGTVTFTVTGTSGTLSHSASASLTLR
jgi:subtilase family serine protease